MDWTWNIFVDRAKVMREVKSHNEYINLQEIQEKFQI